MAPRKITCLVTLHGIGFQQPPQQGIPGYADDLHANLCKHLDTTLLGNTPLYVTGTGIPGANSSDPGLSALGVWDESQTRAIDISRAPLIDQDQAIAHVALVYAPLEAHDPHLGSAVETAVMAAFSLERYASLIGLGQMLMEDVTSMLAHRAPANAPTAPPASLRVRTDVALPSRQGITGQQHDPTGLQANVRQLEDDVAAYVCRNDLRSRVRGFVREALLRLVYRPDIESIVVNSHSNGTVIGFDVLRELPYYSMPKLKTFITAGSPLRKYSDLFWWGNDIGSVQSIPQWLNYWDVKDPVADPLAPSQEWRHGMDPAWAQGQMGLYGAANPDTAVISPCTVHDQLIDNVKNSPAGGLQAHNYWDNEPEFVTPLAAMLQQLAASTPAHVLTR